VHDVRHGIWWALIGLLGCRLLGLVGQLGATFATVAGLSGETRVLDGVFGPAIPLASLVGGAGCLLATVALQTALLCAVAWRAAPIRWIAMLVVTVVSIPAALALPFLEGAVGAGSALAMSRVGVDALVDFSAASALLALLQLWLGAIPLIAALVTVVIRARPASGTG
jgi:hypothetical protein